MIYIDFAHLDAMLARIADDLGGRIEAHRLRVEQSAAKGRGIFPLEPARDVDEVGEARRMAFGKTIFSKTLDLVEATLREIRVISPADHPPDHLLLECADVALGTEGRHCLPQL